MTAPWLHLLANFSVIALIISVWTHSQDWTDTWHARLRAIAFGLLMGVGAVGLMLFPFEIRQGIFVDLRTSLISMAGFMGGPVGAVIAGTIGVLYRLSVGGAGAWAGTVGIVSAATVGIIGHLLLRGRKPNRRDAIIFAAVAAITAACNFLTLPQPLRADLFGHVVPPLVILIFVSTFISLLAIVQERRRREAFKENHLYRAVIEALPDCLNIKDLSGRFLVANPATADLMHAKKAKDLIGKTDFDFYPRETAETFKLEEDAVLRLGETQAMEQRIVRPDGTVIWLSSLKAPVRDETGALAGIITHNRDVTDRMKMQIELVESRNRLSAALAGMTDGLAMFDANARLLFCNERYKSYFPKTADVRVPGAPLRDILHASVERGEQTFSAAGDAERWIEDACASLNYANEREMMIEDGRWLQLRISPDVNGSTLVMMTDISTRKAAEEQSKALNRKLELLSRTDGLTGLTNRRGFDEAIDTEFARSLRSRTPLSLLFIDIDRFKAFNDAYGHLAGDDALKKIAACLRGALKRPSDIAARYGGEELVAVLPDTDEDGAMAVAESYRMAVRALAIVHGESDMGVVTVSIGVATHIPDDRLKLSAELIAQADTALYGAKSSGRDRTVGWRPRLLATA